MRDNRDILEKLRATIADMEYMEVPGEWIVPVEEARDEIARLRAENERLRAALKPILNYPNIREKIGNQLYDLGRAALDGQPAQPQEEA